MTVGPSPVSVDWTGTGIWPAANGTKSIDLDGAEGAPGAVSQTFDTTRQHLRRHLRHVGQPGPATRAIKTMTVDATGGRRSTFTYDTTRQGQHPPLDMKWVPKSYTFVATSASTTLTFTSTTSSGYGPAIDNVVITETLKTGADCKNGGWKTMVDKYSTPFKNQGDCVSYYATGEKNLAN